MKSLDKKKGIKDFSGHNYYENDYDKPKELEWEKEFELWCDVTEVDRVSRESIKGFITTELLGKILEHNKDEMTGLYDFDGIALEVISLVKK